MSYGTAETFLAADELVLSEIAHRGVGEAESIHLAEEVREAGWVLPAPDGRQLARAMSLALEDAAAGPDEVDAVFADGLGLPEADAAGVRAMYAVFGDRATSVPVTVPKSMAGRLYAGGSSLDAATAALALASGELPPTINFRHPAPGCDLDIVTETRSLPLRTVLVAARGAGGFNSALVLRKMAE